MEHENKLRLLYIQKILTEMTDEFHPLSTSQIIEILRSKYGIQAHRVTVGEDIEALQSFGEDIVKVRTTQSKFFLGSRKFESPEIKILTDAIISSKMLTPYKSEILIAKLMSLTDSHTSDALSKNLYSASQHKTANEKIYYIVDAIETAINENKKITFRYFSFNEQKQRVLRHDGKPYIFSPYTTVWNGDNYYMLGVCESHPGVSVFRVDRIAERPQIINCKSDPIPDDFDLNSFMRAAFKMYDDKRETVTLLCRNDTMDAIIDRFGEQIEVKKYDGESFTAKTEVALSRVFYNWIFGFAGKVSILSPTAAREEYKTLLLNAIASI